MSEQETQTKVTSLPALKEALAEQHDCQIGEKKLRDALADDRCPQKQAETGYEVERIFAWLVEHEVVADPAAPDDPDEKQSDEKSQTPDPETLEKRYTPGTVVCSWCAIPVKVQNTSGMFQHFEKCSKCGHRPPKRLRPQAREIMTTQRNQQARREPAVRRP